MSKKFYGGPMAHLHETIDRLQGEKEILQGQRAILRAKCKKIIKWLERLAVQSDKQAATTDRFPSLQAASITDAKNSRATAADIQKVIDETEKP